MTQEDLKKYRKIKTEIMDLTQRLKNFKAEDENNEAGWKQKPNQNMKSNHLNYNQVQEEQIKLQLELLKERSDKLTDLLKQEEVIQNFIFSIQDSELRQIFTLRFIDGMTQDLIGDMLHLDRSTVSKRISRYFKEHSVF